MISRVLRFAQRCASLACACACAQLGSPGGLNVALADAGNLPLYCDLDKETRQRCEDAAWPCSADWKCPSPLCRALPALSLCSACALCLWAAWGPRMLVPTEVILNSGKDEAVLKSFMGFLSFRSGATVCLPLQARASKKVRTIRREPTGEPTENGRSWRPAQPFALQATVPKDTSGQEAPGTSETSM